MVGDSGRIFSGAWKKRRWPHRGNYRAMQGHSRTYVWSSPCEGETKGNLQVGSLSSPVSHWSDFILNVVNHDYLLLTPEMSMTILPPTPQPPTPPPPATHTHIPCCLPAFCLLKKKDYVFLFSEAPWYFFPKLIAWLYFPFLFNFVNNKNPWL